ncbi:hypothetical protein PRZ48_007690 [Zasmidium cellare]|uniref:CFEM domain-containing protein n=1 Tax=Zasmidium cellare TaxID=395010 RepID=A0ABR0EKT9_ZASCE|nr:hypothetical protein PRZ48_007690 [Zasmidium cellare]
MRVLQWVSLTLFAALATAASTAEEQEQAAALQLLSSMPACGLSCLQTAIAASPCSSTDIPCSCSNATITAEVQACVLQSCSIKNQLTTQNTTDTLCQRPVRDRTKAVSYSGIIGVVIAFIAYALRMSSKMSCKGCSRLTFTSQLWWDDAVMTFAMALVIPLSILSVDLANLGLGKDIWTLPFENITAILKVYYADEDLYLSALPAIKISMCLTYLRIFDSQRFRYIVYFVIGLNLCYGIAFVLVSVFQCWPISFAWTHWHGETVGRCNNINAQGWASAAFNVILDIIVLALPMPMLWKMQLNKRKKFLVMLMFGVGGFVTVVSILRLQVLIEFGDSSNLTWHYTAVGYWSTIELHAAVVCACMPSIRNIIRRFLPRLMGSTYEESKRTGNGTGLSGPTAVNSGIGKFEPQVQVRPRSSDEENFIPLVDMDGNTIRSAAAPQTAGGSTIHTQDHSYLRPVSPM